MSGRDGRNGLLGYYAVRGALVVVVIAAVLGVFGTGNAIKRPNLSLTGILGLAVMAIGLGVTVVASALRQKDETQGKAAAFRLAGVMICGIGAIMVICL